LAPRKVDGFRKASPLVEVDPALRRAVVASVLRAAGSEKAAFALPTDDELSRAADTLLERGYGKA